MENLHVRDSSYGAVNTKIATKEISKALLCNSVVKNLGTCDSM
jgi:hypothetical protein